MIEWRAVTIGGFVVLGAIALLLVVITAHTGRATRNGEHRPGRISGFGETLMALGRRRASRAVIVVCWAWLGWHFLSR